MEERVKLLRLFLLLSTSRHFSTNKQTNNEPPNFPIPCEIAQENKTHNKDSLMMVLNQKFLALF